MNPTSDKPVFAKRSVTGRYLTAAVATLATNAALFALLSSNAASVPDTAQPTPQAFPLEILDMQVATSEPEPRELLTPPPETEPPPELPLPTLALQAPTIPEPVQLEWATNFPNRITLNMRDIAIPEAYTPRVPIARPAAPTKPVRKPAKPKPIGLTRGPIRIDPPNLSDYYPRGALRRRITGVTTVELVIDKTGRVTNITILASTPAGVFENAARRHAQASRFQPALQNGQSVRALVRYNIKWKLPERNDR